MVGVIIGDELNKISAERKEITRQMTIANNVQIKDVSTKDFFVGADKKQGLCFDFQFTTKYDETGSNIQIEGAIFYIDDKDVLKKIEDEWKKNKKVDDEKTILPVLNRALEMGYTQAIALSDLLRLPAPIQMPRFIGKEKIDRIKPAKAS